MPKSRSKRARRQPPPKPKPKTSPAWIGALFFVLLLGGTVVIITNYMGIFEGGTVNSRLWYGLGLIAGAFIVATKWH
jgi:cell division protein CrgA